MKRQSTVAKLSSTLLRQLVQFCKAYNCGIILRVSGVEYGYDAAQLEFTFGSILSGNRSANKFFDMIGSVVPCIRKGWNSTVGQLDWFLSETNPLATPAQLLERCSIEA